jgi:hypothetical protein
MGTTTAGVSQPTCFVVMGFGKKTDFETGRVLDLDKSYRNMIKPAVEAAGLQCIRADEIVHSGLIDIPMYQKLLDADVVVADLSTSNKNALYELGVRHALRPYTTVVIAEDGIKTFPFDINHVVIRQYHHLGEDIGYDEAIRFREELADAIRKIMKDKPPAYDSPVYSYLKELTPPRLAAAVQEKVRQLAGDAIQRAALVAAAPVPPAFAEPHSVLMAQVDAAQARGDWSTAKQLLTIIRTLTKDDPYILQRLALATYKDKTADPTTALLEALAILRLLQPDTSNDTETLGLWGAVNKRLWEQKQDITYLNEAVTAYERGFYLRNDYYNGINYAFLLNLRSSVSSTRADAIADFVYAERVRREVLPICIDWLTANPMPAANVEVGVMADYLTVSYWVKATMVEAYVGLGQEEPARQLLAEIAAMHLAAWMIQSTQDQLDKLRALLVNDPRKFIQD